MTKTVAAAVALLLCSTLLGGCVFGQDEEKGVGATQDARTRTSEQLLGALDDLGPDRTVVSKVGQWLLCGAGPVASVKYGATARLATGGATPDETLLGLADDLVEAGWSVTAEGDEPEVYRDLAKDGATVRLRLVRGDDSMVSAATTSQCVEVEDEEVETYDFNATEDLTPR